MLCISGPRPSFSWCLSYALALFWELVSSQKVPSFFGFFMRPFYQPFFCYIIVSMSCIFMIFLGVWRWRLVFFWKRNCVLSFLLLIISAWCCLYLLINVKYELWVLVSMRKVWFYSLLLLFICFCWFKDLEFVVDLRLVSS